MTSMLIRKRSRCYNSTDNVTNIGPNAKRPKLLTLKFFTEGNDRRSALVLADDDSSTSLNSSNGQATELPRFIMSAEPSLCSSPNSVLSLLSSTEFLNSSPAPKFLESYEILQQDTVDHELEEWFSSEFGVQKSCETFVVRQLTKGSNGQHTVGLCRRISHEKYARYVELYRRFTAQPDVEDERFDAEVDYDRDAVQRRLWPDGCRLFSVPDPITLHPKYYIYTPRHHGSLHVYVVDQKKLSNDEALAFFRQIVETVAFCHARGVVLRDVKLRKFVFSDPLRTTLRFCDLDEFYPLDDPCNDSMRERNGCPAYVSPEIIDFRAQTYAGKPADVWGLGVLLYVMLVGRYPFYDTTPLGLFLKIRAAKLPLSERIAGAVPPALRYALRCVLNKEAADRPTAADLLRMPWCYATSSCDDVTKPYLYYSYDHDDVVNDYLSIGCRQSTNGASVVSIDNGADLTRDQLEALN